MATNCCDIIEHKDLYKDDSDDLIITYESEDDFDSEDFIISYDSEDEDVSIGKGSNGTYVFSGKLLNHLTGFSKNVAIKRVVKPPGVSVSADIINEVSHLRQLSHDNIVHYLKAQKISGFVLITLELCLGSLINVLETKRDVFGEQFPSKFKIHLWCTKKHLLKGIAMGLEYIHSENRIHRDLKPQNILVKSSHCDFILKAVISDFGLTEITDADRDEKTVSGGFVGTHGWVACEELMAGKSKKRISSSLDIFAYGCIVQFVMSLKRGKSFCHPFGEDDNRKSSIKEGKRIMTIYENLHPNSFNNGQTYYGEAILADMLIGLCINNSPNDRPSASEIIKHPFFKSYGDKVTMTIKLFNVLVDKKNLATYSSLEPYLCSVEKFWKLNNFDKPSESIKGALNYHIIRMRKAQRSYPLHNSNAVFGFYMKLIHNFHCNCSSAVEFHPPLENAVGDGKNESLGFYFFERVPFLFPVMFSLGQYVNCLVSDMDVYEKMIIMVNQNFKTISDLVSFDQ